MSTAKHRVMVTVCLLALFLCPSVLPSIAEPVDADGWRSDVDFVEEAASSM